MDTDLLLSVHFAIYFPFCGLSFIFKNFFCSTKVLHRVEVQFI